MSGLCRFCRNDAARPESDADLCDACEGEARRAAFERLVSELTAQHDAAVAEQDEVAA